MLLYLQKLTKFWNVVGRFYNLLSHAFFRALEVQPRERSRRGCRQARSQDYCCKASVAWASTETGSPNTWVLHKLGVSWHGYDTTRNHVQEDQLQWWEGKVELKVRLQLQGPKWRCASKCSMAVDSCTLLTSTDSQGARLASYQNHLLSKRCVCS